MRIASYQEACALGLGDVWREAMAGTEDKPSGLKARKQSKSSSPVVVPPAVSQAVDDGFDSKLERQFWARLCEAKERGYFGDVWHHSMKLAVIGDGVGWYTPDFHATLPLLDRLVIYETKGFMREAARLRLIAAANRYPCFDWVLVKREQRVWHCRHVTPKGFARDYFTPDWLS